MTPTGRAGAEVRAVAKIEEVSERAGVSTATVSRALRGLPGMSDATRARVLQAAAELGYVPDPSAASLASGRTRIVGIVVPYVTRWFFASVVDAAQAHLREHGYDVLLYNLGDQGSSERRMEAVAALRKRVAAVMVLSQSLDADEVEALKALHMPVAVVGADVAGLSSVRIDDRMVARLATRHLVDLGHRRIAHIAADIESSQHLRAPHDRLAGYQETLREAGIEPDADLVVCGDWSMRSGAEAVQSLLELPPDRRPTAVFASSDEMAVGALLAAHHLGVSTPSALSVVGVDDNEMSEYLQLTTVRQPVREQGRRAAELLLGQVEGDASPISEVLPIELVVRGSTAPPPGA